MGSACRSAAAGSARAVGLAVLLASAPGLTAGVRAAQAAASSAVATKPAAVAKAQAGKAPADEAARWRAHADNVEIVRDNWGIAHVYGKSDADAVFGMIYAEAEDDFSRIEHNYLISLGRLAEAEGEAAVWSDLRARLFIDPRELERQFARSPPWLKELMTAWADGLNYYLVKHPETAPKVLTHFEPWMALSFTEGSIGGDIETVDLAKLREFYGKETLPPHTAGARDPASAQARARHQLGGSNGFAIAPKLSASHHALLWINPHTSYYFRAEIQVTSEQGLDVYGAVTWGQFFVYQGFNEHNGWMHTSYGGDAIDEYAETMVTKPEGLYYSYAGKLRPLRVDHVSVAFKQQGGLGRREFTVYHSHHGPIIRAEKGRWIAIKLLEDPIPALEQSYLRTKTHDYASFRKIQDMRTDTSNNTVYADGDGAIAYFHGNFIPKRDPRFDYTHPVDGSDPATEWQGPTPLEDTINILNPPNGWLLNTNNWPFTAAGDASPKREKYPVYMWIKGENPRGIHALEVLKGIHDVTLDSLIAAGYDPHLTAFDVLLPPLFADFERLPSNDRRRLTLAEPIQVLRAWDRRTGADSIPTALAIFWGNELLEREGPEARDADEPVYDYLVGHLSAADRIEALDAAVAKLKRDFGRWRTPWGDINRYQRLTDDIVQPFDDAKPSLPVGFASSNWGALASFAGPTVRTTKKIYGTDGNSFIAAVEFGPTVRAKALMSGGESGHPDSPHFTDQAVMFTQGKFRDVLFTRQDVKAHAERTYRP